MLGDLSNVHRTVRDVHASSITDLIIHVGGSSGTVKKSRPVAPVMVKLLAASTTPTGWTRPIAQLTDLTCNDSQLRPVRSTSGRPSVTADVLKNWRVVHH